MSPAPSPGDSPEPPAAPTTSASSQPASVSPASPASPTDPARAAATVPSPTASVSPARRIGWLATISLSLLALVLLLLLGAFLGHWAWNEPRTWAAYPLRLALAFLAVAGPLLWLGATLRRRRPGRVALVATTASVAALIGWLLHDEAAPAPRFQEPQLRAEDPETAASHALLLRYSKRGDTPAPRLPELTFWPSGSASPQNPEAWTSFVQLQREAIAADWAAFAEQRAWFEEVAAAPALGDHLQGIADPIVNFESLRHPTLLLCARATELALAGRGDDAVTTLLPALRVAQGLETHARTLVRRMIAVSLQRTTLQTAAIILEQAKLSPRSHELLAATLKRPYPHEQGARLLILCEYAYFLDAQKLFDRAGAAGAADATSLAQTALVGVRSFLYNSRATTRHHGDALERLANAAARRDLAALEKLAGDGGESMWLLQKNVVGKKLTAMALPAFNKITASYWQTRDEQDALAARLTFP